MTDTASASKGTFTYPRAPITEAIFGVRFVEKLSARDMERLRDRFKTHYTKIENMNRISVEIGGSKVTTGATLSGYKMTAPNAVDLILINEQVFNTSRFAPYENWEKFSSVAFENLDQFTKIVGRKTFSRIATRFINRFDIPVDEIEGRDVAEWVNASVALPETLVKSIGPYSLAVNLVHAGTGAKALVQSGVIAPALLRHISINLDIDVYVDSGITSHKDEVSRIAPILRKAKNDIFESLITEKLRSRFQ